jgi:secondary thiamine-phosphate synthase enzyme
MGEEFTVSTSKRQQIVDITEKVKKIAKKSGVKDGLCNVYTPHATCAVLINENWDPNVMEDILECLDKLVPAGKWRHDKVDNNGASHIKSSILGPSETVHISGGRLILGRWQDIMLADFDGPKERNVIVEIIEKK